MLNRAYHKTGIIRTFSGLLDHLLMDPDHPWGRRPVVGVAQDELA